jgi:hypothetical protein
MSLNRVNLSIKTTTNSGCGGLSFEDTTGNYNALTNPEGYGLPGGIVINDITSAQIMLEHQSTGIYVMFSFTIALGVVTAATVSINGGTATDILSELSSTTFPFTSLNPFNMSGDYGVELPEVKDGLYQTIYTISGESDEGTVPHTEFNYTSSVQELISCETNCCIAKLEASIDPGCDCSSEKMAQAMRARQYLNIAISAAEYGKTSDAVDALNKAKALCDSNCGC